MKHGNPGSKSYLAHKKCEKLKRLNQRSVYTRPGCKFHPNSGCLFLLFKDAHSMHLVLGRPHLFYENQQLKGPLMGVNMPFKSWITWWSKIKNDNNDITEEEILVKEILEKLTKETNTDQQIENANDDNTKVKYIIAILEHDKKSLLHEWSHAKYYMDSVVREGANKLFYSLKEKTIVLITRDLEMRGYKSENIIDEFLAYVVECPNEFGNKLRSELQSIHLKAKDLVGAVPYAEIIEIELDSVSS